ncbi:multicopper oxidase family protein [Dongia rigui]|uniref:Multicopper oxidase family protein n=1 Tax=Dongia rigui TaxID=940149 RepID=A0ABU5E499_9PROT|nr:multicopper oxidase family protein [Dongia rigui]MDY0874378.1 multicopper oxidase family protein [Dongia rigui]
MPRLPGQNPVTRRRAIYSLGGVVLAAGLGYAGGCALAKGGKGSQTYPQAPVMPADAKVHKQTLTAIRRSRQLAAPPAPPTDILGYSDGPTIIRLQQGEWLEAAFTNRLHEHSTIHWHGIRLPNAMDGVPYLTQAPVMPGESFTYRFQPPDTGTFFFHPHCSTVEQLGHGLAGILIVEGDEVRPHDHDLVCVYRDWRIDKDGKYQPLMTDAGASKAGTFGDHRTINDQVQPVFKVPAGGDVRVRFLNVDMSRVVDLGIVGADAWVIATDGNPLPPQKLKSWRLGPAMRADLTLRMPHVAGTRIQLVNYYSAQPIVMAELEAEGTPLDRPAFVPAALKPASIPEPQIDGAETFQLRLSASSAPADLPPDLVLPDGSVLRYADALCLSPKTFWALNGQPWPSASHEVLPPPLVTFQRGKTYIVEIINQTPHIHPIHLHGHTFKVIGSSKGDVVPHWADTTIVAPKERVKVAFVADNPGDWMIHCHIIEHQETGMMGIYRVA